MKLIIDSSVWIEFLSQGPKTKIVEKYFKPPNKIVLPVLVLYEVYKKIKAERGEPEGVFVAAQMERLAHSIVDINNEAAIHAADISLKHKIPMADAFIYAAAVSSEASIITMDAHFKGLPSCTVL